MRLRLTFTRYPGRQCWSQPTLSQSRVHLRSGRDSYLVPALRGHVRTSGLERGIDRVFYRIQNFKGVRTDTAGTNQHCSNRESISDGLTILLRVNTMEDAASRPVKAKALLSRPVVGCTISRAHLTGTRYCEATPNHGVWLHNYCGGRSEGRGRFPSNIT